jgi:hypothetical protein
MRVGWWTGLFMAMLLLTIICSVCEASASPISATQRNIVQYIMTPPVVNFSNPITGVVSLLSAGWDFIVAIWNTFWFNYSFLEQSTLGQYARYFFLTIPMGIIAMWIASMVKGTSV